MFCSRWSPSLTHAIETISLLALEDIDEDEDTPRAARSSAVESNRLPSLDPVLMPPRLSVTSPEPLWLPYFRDRLDKLISVLVMSAFRLRWRPRAGTFIIKPSDIISHRRLRVDEQHKVHLLRWLVAIVYQEYVLLGISPAGSYESAARDSALISQGRR